MSFRKNVLSALLSQGVSFLAMAAASLFIPRFLGVAEFGYWQLFLLYSGYVGIAHLGVNDGVYLRLGGVPRSEVDKREVVGEFLVSTLFQLLISIAMFAISIATVPDGLRLFVMFATALYLVLSNATNFIGYLFQAMNETVLYSTSIMINRGLYLVAILISLVIGIDDCRIFIGLYLACQGVSFAYCVFHFRDFLCWRNFDLKLAMKRGWLDIRAGSKLMVANFASSFVLNAAKFAVDLRWGVSVFSVISFALTLGTFFLSFVNQVAMVLFPALRGYGEHELRGQYLKLRNVLGCVLPIMYVAYFPLAAIISWWLPAYKESVEMLPLILPICLFDSKMSILSNSFYKVTRRENVLLKLNIIACSLSVIGCAFGVFVLGNPIAVVASVVIAIIVRSILSDFYQARVYRFSALRDVVIEVVFTVVFCAAALLHDTSIAMIIVVFSYVVYLAINPNYRREFRQLLPSRNGSRV